MENFLRDQRKERQLANSLEKISRECLWKARVAVTLSLINLSLIKVIDMGMIKNYTIFV